MVAIPNKSVKRNIETSVELYGKVHQYDKPLIEKPGHQSDNFTDFLIMNMLYNSKSHEIKQSFLFPSAHYVMDTVTHAGKLLEYSMSQQVKEPELVYGRYWHGSMFAYKLLFVIGNLSDVRWINFLICTFTMFAFSICFYKHFQPMDFYLTLLSLIFVNYYMIFHSMQFTPAFLIAFFGAVAVLKRFEMKKELVSTFLIIGACTAYFDLLTVPALTVGLPMICWVLKQNSTSDFKADLKQLIQFGAVWICGFIGTWTFKWLLIYCFTDYSIMQEITFKVTERAGVWQGSRLDAIGANFNMLHLVYLNCTILILVLLTIFFFKKGNGKKVVLLMFVAMSPLAWIFLTANHAEMHNWFVYRCLLVTILGVFLSFSQCIDWEKISNLFTRKGKKPV